MSFLPDWPLLSAYTLAVIVLALTPGPDLTFFMAQAVANGRRAGFAAMAGAFTGLLVHSLMVAAGLAALIAHAPDLFSALKWAGAAYLAWLAWSVLRHGSGLGEPVAGSRAASLRRTYLKALAINLLNPKIIVFFLTFLPQFVATGDADAGARLLFLGIWFIAVSIPVTVPMILAADRVSSWVKGSPRALRAMDWLFAGVMGAFAVRLLAARSPG
ncbi:MAG: LysE family translocator [Flavobacteriaceae bacterium]